LDLTESEVLVLDLVAETAVAMEWEVMATDSVPEQGGAE
jgi:hypothetical protein